MLRESRLPTAGIVTVLMVLVSEVVFLSRTESLTGVPAFEPTADEAVYAAKRRLIPRASGRIVLVGDSSCCMDLIPAEVQARTSVPVVNLGTLLYMTPAGFADLGAEAVERDPPPRALVLAVLPRAFEVTEENATEWGQLGRYLVAYHRRSPLFAPGPSDTWHWFYYKHRFNLFPANMGGTFSSFAASLSESDGFFPEPHQYTGVEVRRDLFQPTAFARNAVHHLVQVGASRGLPTILWLTPTPADAVTGEYLTAVDQFIADLRQSEPSLRIPQSQTPVLKPEQFGTATHLTPGAAKEHSQQCGDSIRLILEAR